MSSWVKGQVCGVDNCRSRLWRVIDGRDVCQYGHIKEGFEIADDDDDFANVGKTRLKIGTRKILRKEVETQYAGAEGYALYMQCLQLILRYQIKWLMENKGFPEDFEGIVRSLWTLVVETLDFSRDNLGDFTLSESEDDDSDGIDKSFTPRPKWKQARLKHWRTGANSLTPTHLVSLCYFGTLILKLNYYLFDFFHWIEQNEFPYMRSILYIPEDMIKKLPVQISSILQPKSLPVYNRLLLNAHSIGMYLDNRGIELPLQPIEPLLFKLVHYLFLPPEIYIASEKLAHLLNINCPFNKPKSFPRFPETQAFAIIIIAAKVCYGFDDEFTRVPEDDINPGSQTIDTKLWIDIIRKIWAEDEVFLVADKEDVIYWDQDKIHRYLDWMETSFMNELGSTLPENYRRIERLFPVAKYDKNCNPINSSTSASSSYQPFERKQGNIKDTSLHLTPVELYELTQVIQSTTKSIKRDYTPEQLERLKVKDKILTPGTRYQTYTKGGEYSQIFQIIYLIAIKFFGIKLTDIANIIRGLEAHCNKIEFSAMNKKYT